MSQTIAQRQATQVHVPVAPIIALAVAVIVVAAVLVPLHQPTSATTRTGTSAGAAAVALPAAASEHMNPAMRRHMIEQAHARAQAASPTKWKIVHNHRQGTMLGAFSSGVPALPLAVTGESVRHRPGQFPEKAR